MGSTGPTGLSSDEYYLKRRVKHLDDNRSNYTTNCLLNMHKKIKQLQKGMHLGTHNSLIHQAAYSGSKAAFHPGRHNHSLATLPVNHQSPDHPLTTLDNLHPHNPYTTFETQLSLRKGGEFSSEVRQSRTEKHFRHNLSYL